MRRIQIRIPDPETSPLNVLKPDPDKKNRIVNPSAIEILSHLKRIGKIAFLNVFFCWFFLHALPLFFSASQRICLQRYYVTRHAKLRVLPKN